MDREGVEINPGYNLGPDCLVPVPPGSEINPDSLREPDGTPMGSSGAATIGGGIGLGGLVVGGVLLTQCSGPREGSTLPTVPLGTLEPQPTRQLTPTIEPTSTPSWPEWLENEAKPMMVKLIEQLEPQIREKIGEKTVIAMLAQRRGETFWPSYRAGETTTYVNLAFLADGDEVGGLILNEITITKEGKLKKEQKIVNFVVSGNDLLGQDKEGEIVFRVLNAWTSDGNADPKAQLEVKTEAGFVPLILDETGIERWAVLKVTPNNLNSASLINESEEEVKVPGLAEIVVLIKKDSLPIATVFTPTPEPTKTAEEKPLTKGEIILDGLNLRFGPGMSFRVKANLPEKEIVEIIGRCEDPTHSSWFWYKVKRKDGTEGWVSAYPGYINISGEVRELDPSEVPPLPTPRPTLPSISEKPQPQKTEVPPPPAESTETVILPVPIDAQDLSLSCESSAAAMVARYFQPSPPEGFSNWEEYFIGVIPRHCNPHRGFRGSISGSLSTSCNAEAGLGYGVYAEPVAAALQQTGIPARVEYGVGYDWVAEQIRNGRPVIVWISGKNAPSEYETDPETGQEYVLLLGEHAWTVIGVDGEGANRRFLINDPWRGRQYWVRGFPRWDVFGNMSVVVGPY